MQFTSNIHAHCNRMEMIPSGELSLAGIHYGPNSFAAGADGNQYVDPPPRSLNHPPPSEDPAGTVTGNS